MSAFVVSESQIRAIVSAVVAASHLSPKLYVSGSPSEANGPIYDLTSLKTLNEIGRILWAANVDSVLHRYPGDKPDEYDNPASFTFRAVRVPPLQALKLIHCLDYQSCEPAEWPHSLARRILHAMTDVLIRALPGYDAAAWAYDFASA